MFKNRKVFSEIWEMVDSHEIVLLNGARQTGKTTLLKMIEEKLILEKQIKPENILWFDLEKTADLGIWSKQSSILSQLPVNSKEKYYLFIDEFQRASEIGSSLKVLHDHYPQFKIFITGSASWYLNIKESMAGRKRVISVWPLSFSEFIEWKCDAKTKQYYRMALENINSLPSEILDILNNIYLEFASFGGYPAVALIDNKQEKTKILSEILNSYLTRDIQIWNYAANSLQVKKILTLLASQIGSLLEVKNLSANSELGRTVLINRLELLQNTFILHLVNPYFSNKIKELTKMPKTYLIDCGLRNTLLDNFSIIPQTDNFGHLAENISITEILKCSRILEQVHFWRTARGQEVDLVIKRENNLIPIEVKGGNEKSIPSGLKSFIRQYHPQKAFVLNWSIIQELEYQDCAVKFRPLWFADRI